jgi:Flp pilus assembly protein TadD
MAHNNLGNALRQAGSSEMAEVALRTACELDPHYAEARNNLALLLHYRQQTTEAEAMCRAAIDINPTYVPAQIELGELLHLRADFTGAESAFRAASQADPSSEAAFANLGASLEALGRFDEADQAYQRVLELAPNSAPAHFAVGRRAQEGGDSEAAARSFRRAIATEPKLTAAYLNLSSLPQGLSEAERAHIAALLDGPALLDDDRCNLFYALALAAEREREWEQAWHWAELANELDHKRTAFSESGNLEFVNRTMSLFTTERLASLPQGSQSEKPVFILGMPRSGTTLVEQIVSSHPWAAAGGELVEIVNIVNELPALCADRPYPECVAVLDHAQVQALADRYLGRLERVDPRSARVTDKLPFNFRHLGLIHVLFPKARIIHCRRDPRDIAISCYFTKFHRPISFATSLFELGTYLRHYERLMSHWRRVLPCPMLEVQYEDLVSKPGLHVRRIIDFCALPWDERCLNFHEGVRRVRTASVNQVRRPIYSSSVGRWKCYAKHLLPLFAELEGKLQGLPVNE